MIEKIRRIRSFGSYIAFDWPADLCGLKRYNVFYGWNYSGKTMLSRILRCFEMNSRHVDFPSAEAQVDYAGNLTCSLATQNNPFEIRVFNSDFVRENLKFDAGNVVPILILGATDIAKQNRLDAKKLQRENVEESNRNAEREMNEIIVSLDKAMTAKARDAIKNPLGVPNYDKTRLEPKVKVCKDLPSKFLLDEQSVQKCTAEFLSTDKKELLAKLTDLLTPLEPLITRVANVVTKCVTGQRIARLSNNATAERWVDGGRPLHANAQVCFFCGQPLPTDLLDTFKQHFSEEYDILMKELAELGPDIGKAEGEQLKMPHASEFYPEQAHLYSLEKSAIYSLEQDRYSVLRELAGAVEAKRSKAFTSSGCPYTENPMQALAPHIAVVNELIDQHNERTREFGLNRQIAFSKLELHAAATLVIEQNYVARLSERDSFQSQITAADEELIALDREILELETELSEATRGAERINELLQAYFGKNDLRVRVSADKRFQIVRAAEVARNLSEGEETAIAFAYFITWVQDGRTSLAETIVVIDDPISSLDSNHLFNTYALIKTQIGNCKQLLLLTHSSELFNLAKDWATEDERKKRLQDFEKWGDWRFFLVRRTDDGQSRIEKIPPVLMHFKSEYHYLFSELHRFAADTSGAFDRLFTLSNVTRRFMEAFGGIMIPKSQGLHKKMERLFTDPIERERVWKFINHYSHQTTVMRSLTIPDVSECSAVVNACLNAVRDWNPEYFQDLVSEIS